ncbi:MAG: hypothetical protein KDD62_10670 [Bdellovibrionales bacterium]|nr:hypothetical protein [Bdellovibrionales bacterium]
MSKFPGPQLSTGEQLVFVASNREEYSIDQKLAEAIQSTLCQINLDSRLLAARLLESLVRIAANDNDLSHAQNGKANVYVQFENETFSDSRSMSPEEAVEISSELAWANSAFENVWSTKRSFCGYLAARAGLLESQAGSEFVELVETGFGVWRQGIAYGWEHYLANRPSDSHWGDAPLDKRFDEAVLDIDVASFAATPANSKHILAAYWLTWDARFDSIKLDEESLDFPD